MPIGVYISFFSLLTTHNLAFVLFVLPNLIPEPLTCISLGHGYRILVVLLPNILLASTLTNYHSLLTAHKITLPVQPITC